MRTQKWVVAVALLSLVASGASAALTDSLTQGKPDIKSISQLTFGPEGILFLGDVQGASVFAIDTQDSKKAEPGTKLSIPNVDEKFASILGIESKQLTINDLVVNPISNNAYVSVTRRTDSGATPVLFRISPKGKISEFSLKSVKFAKASLPKADRRRYTVTDLQYFGGNLYVAGLSTEAWRSALYTIPFPFKKNVKMTNVEVYHGAHGKYETRSPVQTFVPYEINGSAHLLAAYTCTPLVKFPISDLKKNARVRGTTIAELGNYNRPLDILVYSKDKKDYLLIANSSRGVMKVTTNNIATITPLTKKVTPRGGTAGLKYETVKDLKDVMQLAKLSNTHALIMTQKSQGFRRPRIGPVSLRAIALP